jgi:hypothetical protein
MLRMVWRQARTRTYRSVALLAAVLVAAVGFAVLVAGAERARLAAGGFVELHARGAYDLLVRPAGSVSAPEQAGGLVRPGHLTGHERGFSVAQWHAIRAVPGVAVAAPAGVVGQVGVELHAVFDVTELLDPAREQQVIRIWPTSTADAGLSSRRHAEPLFAYVTTRPLAVPKYVGEFSSLDPQGREGWLAPDNSFLTQQELLTLGCSDVNVAYFALEQDRSGTWRPVCGTQYLSLHAPSGTVGTPELNSATFAMFQALPDGTFRDVTGLGTMRDAFRTAPRDATAHTVDRVEVAVRVPVWLPVGVVDPTAEAELAGLDRAIVSGDPLPSGVGEPVDNGQGLRVPALVASRIGIDEQLSVAIDRLVDVDPVARRPRTLLAELRSANPDATVTRSQDVAAVYEQAAHAGVIGSRLDRNIRVGAVRLSGPRGGDGPLIAEPVDFDRERAWFTTLSQFGERGVGGQALQPPLAGDVAFRPVTGDAFAQPESSSHPARAVSVGVFDPRRLTAFSTYSELPLELYEYGVPATTADASTVALRPGSSPSNYLALAPSMLISVESARQLTGRDDVIGAIRVRVADVTGVDAASRQRVQDVAATLAKIPGVAVDVTVGASPQLQPVRLAAGAYGRPELVLREHWPRTGAAVEIVRAADAKDLVLFGLILVACLGMLGNAAAASVRERRRELAVLMCLGWSGRRVGAMLIGEAAALGLVAGVLAVPLGALVVALTGGQPAWRLALLAIPVAALVSVAAAAVPAVRAARGYPAVGLHPAVGRFRRSRLTGLWRMAWAEALRTPGRTAAAVVAVTVAVAAIAALLTVQVGFRGTVAGTLLGDAVSVRVRSADLVLLAAVAGIAVATVVDVLYLGVRERAAEFAVLRATGWSDGLVTRLVLYQAALVSGVGALVGLAAVGTVIGQLAGPWPVRALLAHVAAGVAILTLSTLAASWPAAKARALSARTLGDDG